MTDDRHKHYTYETMDDLYEILRKLGCAELHEDDGELVIYTGLTHTDTKSVALYEFNRRLA